jgi:protein TonB
MMMVAKRILITCILFSAASLAALGTTAQQVASTRISLPPMNASVDPDVYPAPALKNGVQGRVLLEFTVSARNRVDDVTVVDSEPQGMFDTAARKTLNAIRFTVPKDWAESGSVLHRFTLSVVFKVSPCPTTPCVAPQPHATADDFLIITAAVKR